MCRNGICPVCRKYKTLTKHHVFKSCVWRDLPETQSKILLVCRECHDAIEIEITRRENEILKLFPDIYTGVVEDYVNGALIVPLSKRTKKSKRQRGKKNGSKQIILGRKGNGICENEYTRFEAFAKAN